MAEEFQLRLFLFHPKLPQHEKNALIAIALLFQHSLKAQVTKAAIYKSNFQIDEANATSYDLSFRIIVNGSNHTLNVIDTKHGTLTTKFKITYIKTTKEDDGTVYWFHLYGNPKFNILKVVEWNDPIQSRRGSYSSNVIFSKYVDGERIADVGYFSNKIQAL